MPNVANFFNIDDESGIPRDLADGLCARIYPGEQAMISIVRIEPNKAGSIHHHPQEQWGFCIRGSGVRTQAGESHRVGAGDFWRTPGNVEHGFTAGDDGALIFDVFAPPREEYLKSGSGFS